MIKINVISNYSGWKNYFKNPNSYIDNKVKTINKKNKNFKDKTIFCTLLLSGSAEIKKLNKKFRNKNKATDVLSFPFYNKKELKKKLYNDKEIYLGDIVVNLDQVQKDKVENNFKLEFNKLWIHGLVHLFGHDHKKDKDYNIMKNIEKKFLSYLY